MEVPTELALSAFKYSHFEDFFEDFFTYFLPIWTTPHPLKIEKPVKLLMPFF